MVNFPRTFDGEKYVGEEEGETAEEAVSFPRVFDGEKYLEPAPEPVQVEQLPDGQFVTDDGQEHVAEGTGEPMQGVEHPADGSWSPEIGE